MSAKQFYLNVKIGVLHNVPDRGGYQIEGEYIPDIYEIKGKGFVVHYHSNGSGTAFYGNIMQAGSRTAQYTVAVSWSSCLPMIYISSLKRQMEKITELDVGERTLTLETSSRLPEASAEVVCGILEAIYSDQCLIFKPGDKYWSERGDGVLKALNRVPVSQNDYSIAMPLPPDYPPCTITLYPNQTDFVAAQPRKRVNTEEHLSKRFEISKYRGIAKCIAEADPRIARAAIENNSTRVYYIYGAIRGNLITDMSDNDKAYIDIVLDNMDKEEKNQFVYTSLLLGKVKNPSRSDSGRRRDKEELRAKNRKKVNRFTFVVCVLISAFLLFCRSAVTSEAPETLTSADCIAAAVTAICGFGIGFILRRDR